MPGHYGDMKKKKTVTKKPRKPKTMLFGGLKKKGGKK